VVYRARNLLNGHSYVGVTRRGLAARERHHRYLARVNKGALLQAAIRKYGGENIVFEVLMDFQDDLELALAYEAELIDAEHPAYNIAPGGTGRTRPLTPEATEKMRTSHIGKPNGMKGKKLSLARREAISEFMKGRPGIFKGRKHTEESKLKMREALAGRVGFWTGKKRPGVAAWKAKPVVCLTDGNRFESAAAAARHYGLEYKTVAGAAAGRPKTVKGYQFKYEAPK
jgi:group I intron endonuclease